MDSVPAKQYEVDEYLLSGLLLSPRSYRNKEGNLVACSYFLPETLEVKMPEGKLLTLEWLGGTNTVTSLWNISLQ